MTEELSKYRVCIDDLEASVRVGPEDVTEEREATPPAEMDGGEGHLPGNVRPFAV